ncbi:MAG: DNA starvation/stationary phase protection protein [Planctomycetes bacterium]|nr:DNA starvation/stationary phase protection protein [Planctomycetota bacterium]
MTNFAHELDALLGDYLVLAQKLRNYHWTVRGPSFFTLHAQFEKLYDDAAEKADAVAERSVALGHRPVPTLARAVAVARLKESPDHRNAMQMVDDVAGDFETLIEAQRDLALAASEHGDMATANLCIGFADAQEKTVWMLRAFLDAPKRA